MYAYLRFDGTYAHSYTKCVLLDLMYMQLYMYLAACQVQNLSLVNIGTTGPYQLPIGAIIGIFVSMAVVSLVLALCECKTQSQASS